MKKILFSLTLAFSFVMTACNVFASSQNPNIDALWYTRVTKSAAQNGLIHIPHKELGRMDGIDVIMSHSGSPEAVFKKGDGAPMHDRVRKEAFISFMARTLGMSVVVESCEVKALNIAGHREPQRGLLEKFISVYGSYGQPRHAIPELQQALSKHMNKFGSLNLLTLYDVLRKGDDKEAELIVRSISRKSVEELYILYILTDSRSSQPYATFIQMNAQGCLDLVLMGTQYTFESMSPTCSSWELPQGNFCFSQEGIALIRSLKPDAEPLKSLITKKASDAIIEIQINDFKERLRHFQSMALSYPDLTIRQIHERAFLFTRFAFESHNIYLSQGHYNVANMGGKHFLILKDENVALLDPAYNNALRFQSTYDDDRIPSLLRTLKYLTNLRCTYGYCVLKPVIEAMTHSNPELNNALVNDPRNTCLKIKAALDAKLAELQESVYPWGK